MNPWEQKEMIDITIAVADRNGFRLDRHDRIPGTICLFTKGAKEHGFADNVALQAFSSWEEANAFFIGWEMHDLAQAVARSQGSKS